MRKKTNHQKKDDFIVVDVTRHSGRELSTEERLSVDLVKTNNLLKAVTLEKIKLEKKLTSSWEGLKCLERKMRLRKAFLLDQVDEMTNMIDQVSNILKTYEEKVEE